MTSNGVLATHLPTFLHTHALIPLFLFPLPVGRLHSARLCSISNLEGYLAKSIVFVVYCMRWEMYNRYSCYR
ncbi:hypothetical protein B484DRAFT_238801 [Ochromonadaceae sp. CCMP2298]|nr:hypothetical protein B484DRAFT_238801 [Ochromonadaceae sp. CCMP2298]